MKSMLPRAYELGAVALSGGQAVEIAMKTAMLATKKAGFIVFDDAYHGVDLGVLPLTARFDFNDPFRRWLQDEHVVRLPYGASCEQLEQAVVRLADSGLAAIVAEPIQGRAGVRLPTDGWLQMLAQVAHAHGGLLILDEVFTGFGRIGRTSTAEVVDADISCFGKAIGGGFPISACFAKRHVMNAWPESTGEAIHTGTFFGHPFSAAVGWRTLREIQSQNLALRARVLGEKTRSWLKDAVSGNPRVRDVRGVGLMIGVEFDQPGYAAKLMDDLRSVQVIALPSGSSGAVLSITPALNIPEDDLSLALERMVKLIR
jgi:4-aminobutyrate aminotransferase/(S)-3-amino-2-methylpropionate transaminase